MRTFKIVKTGQLIYSKDMDNFWSNYVGEDPFNGWVVLNKAEFEKMYNNKEIIEKK